MSCNADTLCTVSDPPLYVGIPAAGASDGGEEGTGEQGRHVGRGHQEGGHRPAAAVAQALRDGLQEGGWTGCFFVVGFE